MSMSNTEIYCAIDACISRRTDIRADIRFREGSSSIMISWQGVIPDEITTSIIEEDLEQFGTPVPNHDREFNFVSFLVLR